MSRESEPGLQHARSTNIRPLEWKLKYEELEKNYAQLEQKFNSLQQQLSERETEQTYSATSTFSRSGNASPTTSPYGSSSNPLGSHGRHDIVEAYKRTVAQLQEQKKVADERVSQLSQQLIQERTERNERGERLERSSNFERLERGSNFTMGGERLERQSNRDGLSKRPLQRARDNGLTSTLVPSQSGRDLSPMNSPRGERENGENESANVAQLRDRVIGLESKLRENEIRARNDILKLRQKAQTAMDTVKQTSERQASEIRALRRERDEAEARLEERESQLLATISELKMKHLEVHQTSADVQRVMAGLEAKLAERKERIVELMVSVERERRKYARREKEVEAGRGPSSREKELLGSGDLRRDRGISGGGSPRAMTTNDRMERDRPVVDPPMMKAPSQANPSAGRGGRGGPAKAIGGKKPEEKDAKGSTGQSEKERPDEASKSPPLSPRQGNAGQAKKAPQKPKGAADMTDIISQIANGGFRLKKVGPTPSEASPSPHKGAAIKASTPVALERVEQSVENAKRQRRETKNDRARMEASLTELTQAPLVSLDDLMFDLINFEREVIVDEG